MSQRSDISASIQANFPDNTSQFITPARIRSEQYTFLNDTVLNEQTASIIAQAVASASVASGVSYTDFNAYTGSTNTFTGSIQTQVNALEAATGSYITNAQTSSMSVLSASFASSSVSASYALTASFALNAGGTINTGSFATTGSNTFNGTNTFTGSVNIQSASITFLTVDTIVSSSTIFSSGSNTLGDAAGDTQTLWGTVLLPSGPLQVTGSVSSTGGFTGSFQGTASYATQALSASYAPSIPTDTGSLLVTASAALNTITFTKGDASTFNVTVDTGSAGGGAFPYTGSAQISGSLTITNDTDGVVFDIKQPSHTTESIYSIRLGNQADVTESIAVGSNLLLSGSFNNTYRIVIPTTIDNLTGSLLGTASYAAQALSASWAPSAGAMNLGANTFTGSQTIASSSVYIFPTGSTPLYVTESAAKGNLVFGNITAASSGSIVVTGSSNILLGPLALTTAQAGWNGNRNIMVNTATYSGSVPSVNATYNIGNLIVSSSGTGNNGISSLFNNGGVTVTNTSPNGGTTISTSNINASTTIRHAASGSTANNGALTISTTNLGGSVLIATTGSSTAAKTIASSMFIGTNNTASLEAASNSNLAGTIVLGSNLVVSGTLGANSQSGSVFVGQFNETGSLADPSQIKFAVGAGLTSATRETAFYVSQSGDVVIKPNTTGFGRSLFTDNAVRVGDGVVNGSFSNVATGNGVFVVNQGTITAGQTNVLIAGEVNTITAARSSAIIAGSYNTINTNTGIGDTNNLLLGTLGATISGSLSRYTGIFISSGSAISQSLFSAIIAGNAGTQLNNTTGSVALGRDTAYTGTANYTLYTQNVNVSGSLTVNGNKQYNVGSFYSTASQSGSANVSQSITYNSTDISSGVSIVSGSQITLTNAGTYNIQFSAQVDRIAGSGTDTVNIWLKKNGTNVTNSAGAITISGGAAAAKTIAAWNYIVDAAANDNFELVWQTTDSNIQLINAAASGNVPDIPSIILTVTQVR